MSIEQTIMEFNMPNYRASYKWETLIKEYVISGARFSLLEFLNILSGRIDLVMLSFLTTPANVGIYALAYRLVEKGLVLRAPISQSLFPYYSSKYGKLKPKVKELIVHTLLISIPLLVFLIPGIILIEPAIIRFIGYEFQESADIFQILGIYLIFNFSVLPWGLYLQTTKNEKFVIYTVSITSIVNIILNIVFYNRFGIIGIAYSTLLVQLINFFLQSLFTIKFIK